MVLSLGQCQPPAYRASLIHECRIVVIVPTAGLRASGHPYECSCVGRRTLYLSAPPLNRNLDRAFLNWHPVVCLLRCPRFAIRSV